ncbi:MAG TPA: hypothetical protein VFW11_04750 [Cyclobacteriaceae bacterium]|nr:hypothetical protein [Cyclobacteriaceae bacterium]
MRRRLGKSVGDRKVFKATFSRLGKKTNYRGYREDTILLIDVVDAETNESVADHVWFTHSKGFEGIALKEGMRLQFEARIKEYRKGYVNARYKMNERGKDYKLSYPTKIKVIRDGSSNTDASI